MKNGELAIARISFARRASRGYLKPVNFT